MVRRNAKRRSATTLFGIGGLGAVVVVVFAALCGASMAVSAIGGGLAAAAFAVAVWRRSRHDDAPSGDAAPIGKVSQHGTNKP